MRRHETFPSVVGLLLGALQTGLYFQLTFTLSSSFGTYLMITLCWMVGSMIGVLWLAKKAIPTLLVLLIAAIAYIFCSLLLLLMPFNTALLPIYALLVIQIGLYPGVFFARSSGIYRAGVLFFRENNGFIAGMALGTVLFMLFGRPVLWLPIIFLVAYVAVVGASLNAPESAAQS